ncbi:MAG: phage portal protein [Paracoccus sp. (in: a-proteobacteria)]|nr:phage portal protein [Paracoccus sp. (in: a-proteobacteria)]
MFGWLFKRAEPQVEKREARSGFTAEIMAARESYISGRSGIGELTGVVQGAVALWEGALAASDVIGTDLLDRRSMAICGRALALRGEAVFLIRDDRIIPASHWDLSTRDGEPRAYRIGISDAGGGRTTTALAGEVLHFRLASDPVAPWAGQAPLRRAALSASLLQEVESALRDVYRDAPLGSMILPLPDSSADDMDKMRGAFRGRRGATLVVEGVAQAVAAGQHPLADKRPDHLSPDLSKSMTTETLDAARDAICWAYGVIPGMMNRAATGPVIREGQRHLATWMLQPIADLMAEEATRKMGSEVRIDVMRNLQAFDAGGRARALATIIGALSQAKEAGIDPAQALKLVDWTEGE